jgi:hypothetical protein
MDDRVAAAAAALSFDLLTGLPDLTSGSGAPDSISSPGSKEEEVR